MRFYRKNIGNAHQAARIILGIVVMIAAFVSLSSTFAWLTALGGLVFALSGLFGYCPICAVAGIARRDKS